MEQVLIWVGTGLGAVGLGVVLYALRGSPGRGRRRCPRCWYDMSGVPGLTCPECGRTVRDERGLLRRRRYWRLAVFGGAALMLAGYAAIAAPRARQNGWSGAVPTVALIVLWPWTAEATPPPLPAPTQTLVRDADGQLRWVAAPVVPPPPADWRERLYVELRDRPPGRMWSWQRGLAVAIAARTWDGVEPGSSEWERTYGAVLRAWEGGEHLSKGQRVRLWRALCGGTVWTRGRWPVGAPVPAVVAPPKLWVGGGDTFSAELLVPGAEAMRGAPEVFTAMRLTTWPGWRASPFGGVRTIEAAGAPTARSVGADVRVRYRLVLDGETFTEERRFPLTIVGSIDEAIEPVRDEATDAMLAAGVRLEITRGGLELVGRYAELDQLDGAVFAPKVVLRRADGSAVTMRAPHAVPQWIVRGLHRPAAEYRLALTPVEDADLSFLVDGSGGWSAVVEPDPEHALRELDAELYWAGEIVIKAGDVRDARGEGERR